MNHAPTAAGAALLAALLAGPAGAQSSVTVYGIADAGVEYQRATAGASGPATSSRQVVTGSYSSSRLGFRGTEDLGGGLRALFQLELGLNIDDGNITGTTFFGRRSIVGLGSPWGELTLGRDYTPAFWVQLYTDVNGFSLYGNSATMGQFGLTGMLRTNNGLFYASPEFGGFRARVTYGFGDERTAAPTDAGRIAGVSGEYRSPTLSAGAYYQTRRVQFPANASTSESASYAGVNALYNFGSWSIDAGYSRYDPAGPDTATSGVTSGLWGGVLVTMGLNELRVNLGRIRTDLSRAPSARSTVMGINYGYLLSKRTTLYAGIGRISNNGAAAVALEAGTRAIALTGGRGSDPTATTVGIRHAF